METNEHTTKTTTIGQQQQRENKNTFRKMTMKTQPQSIYHKLMEVLLRGKFIAMQAFFKKTRKISNKQPNLPLKRIRKGSTNKTESQKKEENKDQRKIKQIKKRQEKIHKTKSWFFERIKKIDKPLARLTKKRERTQIRIRSDKREISTKPAEIHKTIREYCE